MKKQIVISALALALTLSANASTSTDDTLPAADLNRGGGGWPIKPKLKNALTQDNQYLKRGGGGWPIKPKQR